MRFEEAARALAEDVRKTGRGFLTMRRDDLRTTFGIERFTEKQSDQILQALEKEGLRAYPAPWSNAASLRLYDRNHPVGAVFDAVLLPNELPDSALRRVAELFAKEAAGRDLRSADAPWLHVFDLFLQVLSGRELKEWEELNDERHPAELARDLAKALGLEAAKAERTATRKLAATVCSFRPRPHQLWLSAALAEMGGSETEATAFGETLAGAHRTLQHEHHRLLEAAARLLLACDTIPRHHVELGLLGLRPRREGAERND